jgi:hypothetical protein
MNNIYSVIFTLLGAMSFVVLFILIRYINDARYIGYRVRRWKEKTKPDEFGRWRPWFAWRPVRTVGGELIWWDTVYRQLGNNYSDQDDWSWYYYGTVMDVLKDTK